MTFKSFLKTIGVVLILQFTILCSILTIKVMTMMLAGF